MATLLDLQLITFQVVEEEKEYFVSDKYLDYWLRKIY